MQISPCFFGFWMLDVGQNCNNVNNVNKVFLYLFLIFSVRSFCQIFVTFVTKWRKPSVYKGLQCKQSCNKVVAKSTLLHFPAPVSHRFPLFWRRIDRSVTVSDDAAGREIRGTKVTKGTKLSIIIFEVFIGLFQNYVTFVPKCRKPALHKALRRNKGGNKVGTKVTKSAFLSY